MNAGRTNVQSVRVKVNVAAKGVKKNGKIPSQPEKAGDEVTKYVCHICNSKLLLFARLKFDEWSRHIDTSAVYCDKADCSEFHKFVLNKDKKES